MFMGCYNNAQKNKLKLKIQRIQLWNNAIWREQTSVKYVRIWEAVRASTKRPRRRTIDRAKRNIWRKTAHKRKSTVMVKTLCFFSKYREPHAGQATEKNAVAS